MMRSSNRDRTDPSVVPEQVWIQRGQDRALAVFRRAARGVPAYRAFLKEHGVRLRDIRTFEDFQQLPTTSKEGYLLKHDLAELMPGGKLDGTRVFATSSGSTGQPIFWPRLKRQDDGALRGIQAYYSLFDINRKSTLLLMTLSLGMHIAGQYMTELSLRVARMPGNRLTVVTPGCSVVEDSLELVKHLSPRFDQTLILAYPSFAQRLVAAGTDWGVSWQELNAFLMTGGESYSEGWRSLMVERLGCLPHPMRVCGVYGTSDGGGIMGFETPFSILGRQLAHQREDIRRCLFDGRLEAAFVQFNPMARYFEEVNGELTLTCWQAVPLIRYALHDAGDVMPFSMVTKRLRSCDADPEVLLRARGVAPQHIWQWPFLSCFGRSDGAVSVAAANVYPHMLQHVFAAHREVSHYKLAVEGSGGIENRFIVYVELAERTKLTDDARTKLERMLHDEVVTTLSRSSSEYRESLVEAAEVADPSIVLVPYGSGLFAADAGRQKRSYLHKGSVADQHSEGESR